MARVTFIGMWDCQKGIVYVPSNLLPTRKESNALKRVARKAANKALERLGYYK